MLLTQCKKAETILSTPSMAVNIDNVNWSTSVCTGMVKGSGYTITGTNSNGELMTITILGTDLKTYNLDISKSQVAFSAIYKAGSNILDTNFWYIAKKGTLSLDSKSSNKLSGTFNFELDRVSTETQIVTNGSFTKLNYNNIPTSGGVSATINSKVWTSSTSLATDINKKISITVTGSNNDIYSITLLGDTVGTYLLNPLTFKVDFASVYKIAGSTADSLWYTGKEGKCIITTIDTVNKTITGTFSMNNTRIVTERKVCTAGTFSNILLINTISQLFTVKRYLETSPLLSM
jgi:hypothetical protein